MQSKFLVTFLSIGLTAILFNSCSQSAAEKAAETTKPGDYKRVELTENAKHAMDLAIDLQTANANQEITLDFSVKDKEGKPFDKFQVVHEKLMHLLVVSDDLAFFDHVHPEKQSGGVFKLKYKFPNGGVYKLYADFTPENTSQIVNVFELSVDGEQRQRSALKTDTDFTKTFDDLTFTMKTGDDLKAAKGLTLNFFVKDANGKAVTDLEPYLGAMAHFVVISEDTTKFLHVHAMEGKMTGTTESGSHGDHSGQHGGHGDMEMDVKADADNAETPTVMAHTEFPAGGIYKLWGQFQRGGKVYTVSFVLNIAAVDAKTS